ncbi:MAG TPA: hypothetical protein DHW71_16155 [Gammaproteobacteria bacterium]|nr:hypothetical protein [Gammaproteobacteria bacterium]MEC8010593.1 type II secretion system protein N [Pseudomonadota bacterium]HBF09030.1 hypothetical protein [Gammaproteobacteria bacterium]HCK94529.1 hypothetical protein [Gammaproteobacteria bacterium]
MKEIKEQSIRWGISAVSVLCLIAIGIYLAQLVWLLLSGVEKPALTTSDAQENVAEPLAEVDLGQLQKWNLMGSLAKKEAAPAPVTAPKTTLKLELLGVFLGKEGAVSTAIIGEIGKSPDYFKEGDKIANGVTLKEVFADRVILNRNGRYETLAFAESTGGADVSMSLPPENRRDFAAARESFLRRSAQQSNGGSNGPIVPAQSQLGMMVQSGNVYSPNAVVQALTQDLTQNPDAALSEMGLVAGDTGGYVISSSAPTDLLSTMGLRVGDRITSIDGQAISGSSSDTALIQSAMQNSNVRVSVQRGTRTFTLNVPVPQ